jgi:protoheme IX farnesyltransferase
VLSAFQERGSEAKALKKTWFDDFMVLIKLRLNLLSVATAWAGFYLAGPAPDGGSLLFFTLLGTTGVAAGSGALNQWLEVEQDRQMHRTQKRPLPSGRMGLPLALGVGLFLSTLGEFLLFWRVNDLTAFLGLAALVSYVLVYTPLKKITSLCTLVGAVPGAIPPLMGWAAVRGQIGLEGWVLFLIMFLWQMPHFLAIAWIYREDYARAGFPMLSVVDPEGRTTGWMAVLYAAVLLPVSLLPYTCKLSGLVYFWTALVLSSVFLGFSWNLALRKTLPQARRLFLVSIIYLTLLFAVMVLDRG